MPESDIWITTVCFSPCGMLTAFDAKHRRVCCRRSDRGHPLPTDVAEVLRCAGPRTRFLWCRLAGPDDAVRSIVQEVPRGQFEEWARKQLPTPPLSYRIVSVYDARAGRAVA